MGDAGLLPLRGCIFKSTSSTEERHQDHFGDTGYPPTGDHFDTDDRELINANWRHFAIKQLIQMQHPIPIYINLFANIISDLP